MPRRLGSLFAVGLLTTMLFATAPAGADAGAAEADGAWRPVTPHVEFDAARGMWRVTFPDLAFGPSAPSAPPGPVPAGGPGDAVRHECVGQPKASVTLVPRLYDHGGWVARVTANPSAQVSGLHLAPWGDDDGARCPTVTGTNPPASSATLSFEVSPAFNGAVFTWAAFCSGFWNGHCSQTGYLLIECGVYAGRAMPEVAGHWMLRPYVYLSCSGYATGHFVPGTWFLLGSTARIAEDYRQWYRPVPPGDAYVYVNSFQPWKAVLTFA